MSKQPGAPALLALLLALSACGGDDSPTAPTSTPVATPPPPVTSVVFQGVFTELPPVSEGQMAWIVQFAIQSPGTLDATVDWTFETNDIEVSLFQGSLEEVAAACPAGQFCEEQVATAFTTSKPERLTFEDATAGPYVLQVVNAGATQEAGTIEILLTTGGASAASVPLPREDAASAGTMRLAPVLGSR